MFSPTRAEFQRLCQRGNLIPVCREHLADLETPVSAFSRFIDDEHAYLLESVEGGERWGRYSFIGVHPRAVFTVGDGGAELVRVDGTVERIGAAVPLFGLRELFAGVRPVVLPGLPRFFAGAVGFLAYEIAGDFERLPVPKRVSGVPKACFMLTEEMAVFDNIRHTVQVIACARPDDFTSADAAYDDACRRIMAIEARLRSARPVAAKVTSSVPPVLQSNMSEAAFHEMVRRAKVHIQEGDIIQAVLSQRFSTELPADPLSIYRALRLINPSP